MPREDVTLSAELMAFLAYLPNWGEWGEKQHDFDLFFDAALPLVQQADPEIASLLKTVSVKAFAEVYVGMGRYLFAVPEDKRSQFFALFRSNFPHVDDIDISGIPEEPGIYFLGEARWSFAWGAWSIGWPVVIAHSMLDRFPSFCHALVHESSHALLGVDKRTASPAERDEFELTAFSSELKISDVIFSAIDSGQLSEDLRSDASIARNRAEKLIRRYSP